MLTTLIIVAILYILLHKDVPKNPNNVRPFHIMTRAEWESPENRREIKCENKTDSVTRVILGCHLSL